MAEESMSLADAIDELRREIIVASDRARDQEIQFEISHMTVELNVVATLGVGGKAGFTVPVVNLELGGSTTSSRQSTHRVAIQFAGPVGPDSAPLRVGRVNGRPIN